MKKQISTPLTLLVCTVALLAALAWKLPDSGRSVVSAQAKAPLGAYGFNASTQPSDPKEGASEVVGVMNFDESGTVSGNAVAVNKGESELRAEALTFTGTYTQNPSGIGTVNLVIGGLEGPAISFAVVVVDAGSGLMLAQTGGGNDLSAGTARKQ